MSPSDRPLPPAPLTPVRSIVVVSDWIAGPDGPDGEAVEPPWTGGGAAPPVVAGSYLERLPLALIAAGAVDQAEVWHYWRGPAPPPFRRESAHLCRRAFRIEGEGAPLASAAMVDFVRAHGAPHVLVVLGLGVAPALLEACADSAIVYNSIDAPALRVPPEVSRRFDLVLTAAPWQSEEVAALHPGMPMLMLPIGPEFAAPQQFRPSGGPKDVDVIYVAAAQPYKRHDILFDALAALPRDVRALCVFGYGELSDALRRRAAEQSLSVEFVGPPGVDYAEVDRLMNRASFGVVCGVDDGAPAILTEYMLAGLPVLANARLACGLQYILPETGMVATAEGFADAIVAMRAGYAGFTPRAAVLERWTWPHSVGKLLACLEPLMQRRG